MHPLHFKHQFKNCFSLHYFIYFEFLTFIELIIDILLTKLFFVFLMKLIILKYSLQIFNKYFTKIITKYFLYQKTVIAMIIKEKGFKQIFECFFLNVIYL